MTLEEFQNCDDIEKMEAFKRATLISEQVGIKASSTLYKLDDFYILVTHSNENGRHLFQYMKVV